MRRLIAAFIFLALSTFSANARTVLTADTNIYFSLAGSDTTGDGTLAAPFGTLQKALTYFCNTIDPAGFQVKIKATGWVSGGEHVFNEGTGAQVCQYMSGNGGPTNTNRFPIIECDPAAPERYRIYGSQRAIFGVSTWQSWFIDGCTLNSADTALQADGPIAFYIRNTRFRYSGTFIQTNLGGVVIIAGPVYFAEFVSFFPLAAGHGGQIAAQPGRSITFEPGFTIGGGGALMAATFTGSITFPSTFSWLGHTLPNTPAYIVTTRGTIFKTGGPNFPANMSTTGPNPSIESLEGKFFP